MLPLNLYILRQREGQKSSKFNKYSISFASASRFLSICSPFVHNYNMKLSNLIEFSWERERQGDKFYCVFLSSDAVSSFISQPLNRTIWMRNSLN